MHLHAVSDIAVYTYLYTCMSLSLSISLYTPIDISACVYVCCIYLYLHRESEKVYGVDVVTGRQRQTPRKLFVAHACECVKVHSVCTHADGWVDRAINKIDR